MRSVRLVPLVALILIVGAAAVPVRGEDALTKADSSAGCSGRCRTVVAAPAPVRVTTSVEPKDVTIGTPFRFTLRVEADPGVRSWCPFWPSDWATSRFAISVRTSRRLLPIGPRSRRLVRAGRLRARLAVRTGGAAGIPSGGRRASANRGAEAGRQHREPDHAGRRRGRHARDQGRPCRSGARRGGGTRSRGGLIAAALAGFGAVQARKPPPSRGRGRGACSSRGRTRSADAPAAERLVERGELERYYVGLSAIVRRYLEDRFGLRAPEMTTEEFLAVAQRNRELVERSIARRFERVSRRRRPRQVRAPRPPRRHAARGLERGA